MVWARVYFFCIIGVAASMAFFASPAKPWLMKKLAERNVPALKRMDSQEHLPSLGLPNDPGKELDEVIAEVRGEIESRRRKSLQKSQTTPTKAPAGTGKNK